VKWGGCECEPSGVKMKGFEWNEVDVGVSPMEWKWKDLNEMRWMLMSAQWSESERTWMKWGGCECTLNGVRVKTWVNWGGHECKYGGMKMKVLEWMNSSGCECKLFSGELIDLSEMKWLWM
jgi:hypothetical protein